MDNVIGEKIKELRQEFGLSQPNLAIKIGVANSVISNWELNKNIPRSDYLILLANTFKTTTDYLLGLENEFSNIKPVAFTHYRSGYKNTIVVYDNSGDKKEYKFNPEKNKQIQNICKAITEE